MLLLIACAADDTAKSVDTADPTETAGDTQGETGFAWDVCDVDAPYDNVADAAAAAEDGVTLTICAGTFEGATLVGRSLALIGQGAGQTTITGDGFTALTVEGGELSLDQLSLTGVSDGEKGAALHAVGATITANGVSIEGLVQPRVVTQSGGSATWTDLTILGNVYPVDEAAQSSLVRVEDEGTIELVRGVLSGNTAWLGVYVYGGRLSLKNTIVAGNNVGPPGVIVAGGDGDEAHTVYNNVIWDNSVEDAESSSLLQLFFTDVRNNIVVGNGGSSYLVYGAAVTEYNLVWDNTAAAVLAGVGNLADDPLLEADYVPGAGSPAVDAGDPDPIFYDPDGTRADIGVYGGPSAMELP